MTEENQAKTNSQSAAETSSPRESQNQTDSSSSKPLNLRETILAAKREAESKAVPEPEPKPEKSDKPEEPEISDKAEGEKRPERKEPEKKASLSEDDKPKKEEPRSKDSDDKPEDEKTQSLKPPTSWSKSSRAEWEGLPRSIQEEVLRRETDTARGVEELKRRHTEEFTTWRSKQADVEEALRPYEEAIQQSGRTKGQVVKDLLDWNMALVGPNRVEAFRALARSFGVDTTQLSGVTAAQSPDGATAADSQPTQPQAYYDNRSWEPAIRSVAQRLEHFEQATAAQRQSQAEQVVSAWSKDKTHFEAVRGLMAQLVDNDAKMGGVRFLKNGQIDMDAAYEAAIWADPETRSHLLKEQRDQHESMVRTAAEKVKADAEARVMAEKQKADAERARRAAVSLRPSAPISGVNGAAPGSIPSRESVRDSIKRALSGV